MSKNSSLPTRRSVLITSAATGAVSLLPIHLAAAGGTRSSQLSANSQMATTKAGAIRPFRINVPEEELLDLRRRIAATRWPDKETVSDRSQGVQLAKLQELVRHWGTDYDWRKAEAKLNALPQFYDGDRRARHSLHPRPLASCERHAADHDAWLARLGIRAAQDYRPADRPDRVWRTRRKTPLTSSFLRCPVTASPASQGDGLESRPHCARLGRADAASGLHALRRPGR